MSILIGMLREVFSKENLLKIEENAVEAVIEKGKLARGLDNLMADKNFEKKFYSEVNYLNSTSKPVLNSFGELFQKETVSIKDINDFYKKAGKQIELCAESSDRLLNLFTEKATSLGIEELSDIKKLYNLYELNKYKQPTNEITLETINSLKNQEERRK